MSHYSLRRSGLSRRRWSRVIRRHDLALNGAIGKQARIGQRNRAGRRGDDLLMWRRTPNHDAHQDHRRDQRGTRKK